LVPGHDLPGVLDTHSALSLAPKLGPALGPAVIVGTGKRDTLADALRRRGVDIVACGPVSSLVRVEGRNRVTAVLLYGQRVACRTLIHAGPWRTDPALRFQACATGTLRLAENVPTSENVELIGAAAEADEPYALGSLQALSHVAICPCMDVTVGEVLAAADTAQRHVEELKRQTSCGMGPCQGFPCWEAMEAVLRKAQGADSSDRPAHRPPRRGITVDQAAALEGLLELEP
jgi:sarcosine oxidase subunit alpha